MRTCHKCHNEFEPTYGIQIQCPQCIAEVERRTGKIESVSKELLDSLEPAQIKHIILSHKFYRTKPPCE